MSQAFTSPFSIRLWAQSRTVVASSRVFQPSRSSACAALASRRRPSSGTTIFTVMSALATEKNAVNLGQGFPDTDGPREVLDAAIDAIDSAARATAVRAALDA